MKNLILFLSCMLMLFASCSQDMPEIQDDVTQQTGLEAARERLFAIITAPAFRQMNANVNNPLGLVKEAKVTAFGRDGQELTRAEEDSVLYYVFRFENGGYAAIGARPGMPELLAYSGGPVIGGDTIGIDIGGDHSDDPIWGGDGSKVYGETYYEWVTTPAYIDLQWGQGEPYNMYVGGGNIQTGCLPTAMAMFMASDKYRPSSYGGYTFDWNKMLTYKSIFYFTDLFAKEEAARQIARLMQCLGKSENLAASYGTTTVADYNNIGRTLRNFGFSNTGYACTYSSIELRNELERGYPVLMWGVNTERDSAHAWVCSGLCKEIHPWKKMTDITVAGEDVYYIYYFNAGWNGRQDGLYSEQVFNFDEGPVKFKRQKESHNYENNVQMHLGVRK